MQLEENLFEPKGILPDRIINLMCHQGVIQSQDEINRSQIQPASLDLRLGSTAYRVRVSFLTNKEGRILDRIREFGMHTINIEDGAVLEKGCVYVIPLMESLELPTGIYGVANAKSTTGRLDLLTRLITDFGSEFDRIEDGYCGPLFAEVCPRSFSVCVKQGTLLNQIRFANGNTRLSTEDYHKICQANHITSDSINLNEGLDFSVDLSLEDDLVGYRAKQHTGIIDLSNSNHYPPRDFWDPVYASNRQIILDPGSFYILASQEEVTIPPSYAAEMTPYLPMVGEFRVHYAGFFDPGFGFQGTGGAGSRGVLEVRCHEVPFLLEHGQKMGKLVFEKMMAEPENPYGSQNYSNYQGQRLKLSRHFKVTN